jgi:hypothetical protein
MDTTEETDKPDLERPCALSSGSPGQQPPFCSGRLLRRTGPATWCVAGLLGTAILTASVAYALRETRIYAATALVEREVHPLIAQAIGEDWQSLPGLDGAGVRTDVLSSAHLAAAATAAGTPAIDSNYLRQHTAVDWQRRSAWIDAVEITITARDEGGVRRAATALAQSYITSKVTTQKTETERARNMLGTQVAAVRKKIQTLSALHRMLELEQEINQIEEDLGSLRAVKARLAAVEQVTQAGHNVSTAMSRTDAFKALQEVERALPTIKLSPEERTAIQRRNEQLRRQLSKAPPMLNEVPAAAPAPPPPGPDPKSVDRLIELDSEIGRLGERLSQRRSQHTQLAATLSEPRHAATTSDSVAAELAAARKQATELEGRDAKLAAIAATAQDENAIRFTVEPAQVRVRTHRLQFSMLLCAGIAGALACMWGTVALSARWDTTIHSIDHVTSATEVPFLGCVHSVPLLR